jgi:hypothetical protein
MTPEAVLEMSYPVANDPAFHIPVSSWNRIRFLHYLLWLNAIKDRAGDSERRSSIDFILVSCIYNLTSCFNF